MSMLYLNNAATSYPKAPGVADAVHNALQNLPGAANRGGIEDFDVFSAVRTELAELLGVFGCAEQIGLGPHATWALNTGIHGLPFVKGDTVLTTAAEHNSVLRPLFALSKSPGVTVHHLPVDATGRVRAELWQQALEALRPRLCVVTHASNVSGAVNDVATLTELAHRFGSLLLVDLSQTLGCQEVRLAEWNVDLAAFTGHKYLLGPQGTGGLYVRPGLNINPFLTGGTGIHSDLDTMPPTMPLHVEAGTNNEPGFYGLLQALKWQRTHPLSQGALKDMAALLRERLRGLGAHVIDPGELSTPVVSFTLDTEGFSPAYLGETLLDSYDIVVRTGLHCAPRVFEYLGVDPKAGTVRVSLSRFTTRAECDEFIEALTEIVRAGA